MNGFLLIDKKTGKTRGWRRWRCDSDADVVDQVEVADDAPEMVAFRMARARRRKIQAMEA